MNESMDRLRDEMAKKYDHPGIQAVGEYLCRRLEDDGEIAPAILAEGKSLTGAFAEIKEYARKHQKDGMCYVSDSTAWEVLDTLRTLPGHQRDVLYLHCVEGYSVEETANILRVRPGTVKSRLSRARAALRKQLQEEPL